MTDSHSDKALWRQFQQNLPHSSRGKVGAGGPAGVEPDPLTLAAWLDGRLEGAEREAIEAWLAEDPRRLDLLLGATEARGLAAVWPKRAEQRAAALVSSARPPLRFLSAAAAAVLLVALSGFELGRFGSEALTDDPSSDFASDLGLLPDFDSTENLL